MNRERISILADAHFLISTCRLNDAFGSVRAGVVRLCEVNLGEPSSSDLVVAFLSFETASLLGSVDSQLSDGSCLGCVQVYWVQVRNQASSDSIVFGGHEQ